MSDQLDSQPGAELRLALALGRASVKALTEISSETAGRVRAELRKEAVGLDMKGSPDAKAAAAAIRRILDES
jgi:hypothetical protein